MENSSSTILGKIAEHELISGKTSAMQVIISFWAYNLYRYFARSDNLSRTLLVQAVAMSTSLSQRSILEGLGARFHAGWKQAWPKTP